MAVITIHNTMGAALIGVICAGILYGVSCVQTWFYFNRYTKDSPYTKSLVAAVWVFDSVHQGLISHTVYYYLINNYGKPNVLDNMIWSILLEVLFNGIMGLLVQGFLTLRVWRLSNQNIWLIILIMGLVLANFACSVAFVIESMQLTTWVQLSRLKGLSMSVNVLGAAADALIAGSLCYFLQRSRTGFKKSDTIITKLTMFTVSTGLLTSICAIASLISIISWTGTLIYVAFYFSLGRLYSNSVLATLNAREAIRGLGSDDEDPSLSLRVSSSISAYPNRFKSDRMPNKISIKIETTQQSVHDLNKRNDSDVHLDHGKRHTRFQHSV